METAQMLSIAPIGDTDPLALPVADVEKAAAYYTETLGFTRRTQQDGPPRTVVLTRGGVTLALTESSRDPEQASCFIGVSSVGALQQEYEALGVNISGIGTMEHDGVRYEVFWAKDLDGICYCIGKEIEREGQTIPHT